MNQTRGSIHLISRALALASLAVIACGHEDNAADPGPSTSVSSAKVPVAIAGAEIAIPGAETAAISTCQTPSDEPSITANGPAPYARAPVTRSTVALAAAPPGAKAKQKLDDAIAKRVATKANDHDESATPLNEAIVAEMEKSAHQDATPPAATPVQVTTTSATVLRAPSAEALAPSRIAFESRLPSTYKLERVRVLVDGAVSYDARAAGSVQVPPGDHVVEVIADYRLTDPVFTYVDDYRLELRSTEVVPASHAPIAFVATASPAGGVTTPMNKRAALAWRSFPAR